MSKMPGCYELMASEYVSANAKGQIVIPVELRRKLKIEEGTKLSLTEEGGRLVLQPITDDFIESLHGILAGRGYPPRLEREPDRELL